MDQLKELVYIVNRNKVKQIDLLDLNAESPSKVNQLYQSISDRAIETDEEAFELLFGKCSSKSAYRNVKHSLRQKLLNTVFFIDTSKCSTDRQQAFYEAHKDFAAAQLLLSKNARKSGVALLERVFKTATHYEFSDLCLPVSRLLRLHYGAREGDAQKYDYYKEESVRYQTLDMLENKAEMYYTDLSLHYVNTSANQAGMQEQAAAYYQELAENLAQCDSYKYRFYTVLVHLFRHTCVNDYESTLSICEEAIQFFEEKPYTANTPIQICLHHQLVAHWQSGRYALGEQAARRSQALVEEGAFNWFKHLEYLFLLKMQSGDYQGAYTVFAEAVEHRRFAALPESVREMWTLYQAYTHLLIDQGLITPAADDSHFTSFRINRFLNDMPLYAKDKRGMNIAILAVQVLFYIQKGKTDTAIDRIEAIEKYCSRYLFSAETMRSYYFIKLLLSIPQGAFHYKRVMRYAEKSLAKLKSISSREVNQHHKIEIIPYERLWEIALSMLEERSTSRVKASA